MLLSCTRRSISSRVQIVPAFFSSFQPASGEVRQKAAAYIRSHKDDFLPFLSGPDGGPLDEFEFEQYCGQVERCCKDGGVWGGEPEVNIWRHSTFAVTFSHFSGYTFWHIV